MNQGIKGVILWAFAAFTIFVNGFIHGLAAGVAAAMAMLRAHKSLPVAALVGLGIACTNAGKRVVVWTDTNPFPNPLPLWPARAPKPAAPVSDITLRVAAAGEGAHEIPPAAAAATSS